MVQRSLAFMHWFQGPSISPWVYAESAAIWAAVSLWRRKRTLQRCQGQIVFEAWMKWTWVVNIWKPWPPSHPPPPDKCQNLKKQKRFSYITCIYIRHLQHGKYVLSMSIALHCSAFNWIELHFIIRFPIFYYRKYNLKKKLIFTPFNLCKLMCSPWQFELRRKKKSRTAD